jgi:hypothetical protein
MSKPIPKHGEIENAIESNTCQKSMEWSPDQLCLLENAASLIDHGTRSPVMQNSPDQDSQFRTACRRWYPSRLVATTLHHSWLMVSGAREMNASPMASPGNSSPSITERTGHVAPRRGLRYSSSIYQQRAWRFADGGLEGAIISFATNIMS